MTNPDELLKYTYAGCLIEETGIRAADLKGIAAVLDDARRQVLEIDVPLFETGGEIPPELQPLDAGFIQMPANILAEYEGLGSESELGCILATAERLQRSVDRVVVLGIGGSYMGAQAMMQACRHPYFNELTRETRGGIPRMYFEGNNVDNDAAQGLLDLLSDAPAARVDDAWAIVVISKSGGTLETAAAFRIFLERLRDHCGSEAALLAERVVPVTGASGKLFDLATAIGCPDIYEVPAGVGGRFSVLSPVGLLPAALLGLDVGRLLQGAVAMNEHFRTAPVGANAVLDYVGVCHLLEDRRMINLRVMSVWAKALESVGLWYDQLLAESLGKQGQGATPLTVVNTRDLHSRAQQHQEGARDKLMTNVILDHWSRPPIEMTTSALNQDQLNKIAGKTMPELMQAAIAGTNQAYRDDGRPTADIHLPRLDEFVLGQLFQMLMLATVVEGRLTGINPYGQPGVEAYKKHMMSYLDLA